MRAIYICLVVAIAGCSPRVESVVSKTAMISVVYRPPALESAVKTLWQKSFPDRHAELVAKSRVRSDPFVQPTGTAEADLVPSALGWDRAIIPRAFEALGHPLQTELGSSAALDHSAGTLSIVHTPEAIEAFERRFPKLTANN